MTINDSNWQFLYDQTGLSLPFNEMYFRYLRDLGYTGTLQDMIAASGLGLNPSGLQNPANADILILPPGTLGGVDFSADSQRNMDFTFARASVGYGLNSQGAYVLFAADEPRRLNGIGILIEPARTNAVVNNTANSGTGIVLTGTTRASLAAGDSPALDAHGKLITQGAGAGDGHLFGNFADLITAGSRHAVSIALKDTGSARYIRIVLSDNVSIVKQFWVDLLLGTVGNVTADCVATVEPLIDGWLGLTFVTNAYTNTTAFGSVNIIVTTAMGSTTRAAGDYKMWGGQVEKDQVTVTSPILTSGTALTRAADDLDLIDFAGDELLFTFNDDTTQVVAGTDPYDVPTNLNRSLIRSVFSSTA